MEYTQTTAKMSICKCDSKYISLRGQTNRKQEMSQTVNGIYQNYCKKVYMSDNIPSDGTKP